MNRTSNNPTEKAVVMLSLNNGDIVEVMPTDVLNIVNDHYFRSLCNQYGISHRNVSTSSLAVIAFLISESQEEDNACELYDLFDEDNGCGLDFNSFLGTDDLAMETANFYIEDILGCTGDTIISIEDRS